MTSYYFDTSALVKRYVMESGSLWVREILNPTAGHIITVCELTPVEVFSTFEAQKRNNAIEDSSLLRDGFLVDYDQQYLSINVTSSTFVNARNLVTQHKLRSLDAIQLACALEFKAISEVPVTFVSADNDLLKAAGGEGFPTENPLDHV